MNSTDDYKEQPKVINGASDTYCVKYLVKLVCMQEQLSVLTVYHLGVAVEVDAIFELK